MKHCKKRCFAAFTLVEVVVVMAVIALLGAIIIPTAAHMRANAKIQQARMDLNDLVTSAARYEATYGRFPATRIAAVEVAGHAADFTFGVVVKFESGGSFLVGSPGSFQMNNAEVVAILMDTEVDRTLGPVVNRNHEDNPRQIRFMNPKRVNGQTGSGINTNGVFWDPWGSPYIVTLDLNYDGRARDGFYSLAAVSQDTNSPSSGLMGLVPTMVQNKVVYEVPTPVIAWSLGPDRKLNPSAKANEQENKDNVLSWR